MNEPEKKTRADPEGRPGRAGSRTTKTSSTRRTPRGRVAIFPNWCKGCDLCVEFCPASVLEHRANGRIAIAHPEKCTACGWCELHCPDFAIFVVQE